MERRFEPAQSADLRLAGGAAVLAAYMSLVLFWVLRQPGGEAAARFVGMVHGLPALGAAAVCLGLGSGKLQPSLWGRLGWRLLALGALAFAAAQAAATYDHLLARLPPGFPGAFDL